MNTSENTRLDSTIFNDANNPNTIPPVPQPGAPVPPPIPAPDAFASSTFDPNATGDASMSYDTVGYPTADPMATQSVMDTNEKKRRKNVAAAIAAGVGGIGIGAAGILLTSFAKGEDKPAAAPSNENGETNTLADQTTDGEIPVAHSVTDDMSFSEAYAAARAEVGPGGAFSWHGQVYSTYTAAEWNAMSPQEQASFNDHFTFFQDGGGHSNPQSAHSPANSNYVAENHQTTHTPEQTQETKPTTHEHQPVHHQTPASESEWIVVHDEASGMNQAITINKDGKIMVYFDDNGDETFDYLWVDLNGNGNLEGEEIASLKELGYTLTVKDVGGFTPQEQLAQMQTEAEGTVVAQEVSPEEERSEENHTDNDDDDVVVADPDDSTMPPVSDDDITFVDAEDPVADDNVTIIDPDDSTMPPVNEEATEQAIITEDTPIDTADSDIAMADTADMDCM